MAQNNIPVSEYFSGQGNILLAEYVGGVIQGYRHIGNVPELKITTDQTVLEHKESTSGARATDLRLTQETKVGVTMTVESLNLENLNLVMYGTSTVTAAGSVVDEAITARSGLTVPLANIGVSNVVVTDNTGATTYVDGTDYTINDSVGSINFVSGGAIADGSVVLVDYDYQKQATTSALTQGRKEYAIRFEGLNTVDNNAPVVIQGWKFSPDALKELALIQDDIDSIPLEGSLLYDASHPTNPYYSVTKLSA